MQGLDVRCLPPVFEMRPHAALLRIFLMLHATPAFASGREGAAFVEPVFWIVVSILGTFLVSLVGGLAYGVIKAVRSGESVLKGCWQGLLRGFLAFVVLCVAASVLLAIAGLLWGGWSLLDTFLLHPV
jgi:hypothetical protein